MYNIVKITDNCKKVWNTKGQDLNPVYSIYEEFRYPSVLKFAKKWEKNPFAEDVSKGKVRNLKLLSDKNYLKSLPKNTVGHAFYEFTKNKEANYITTFIQNTDTRNQEVVNTSKFIGLAHDLHHLLYEYDESLLGEALVQVTQIKFLFNQGSLLLGTMLLIKEALETKNYKKVWSLYKEARKISKDTDWELIFYYTGDFLERDLDSVRTQFNVVPANHFNNYKEKLAA
jgi:ubiquinone biosynthesis protein Coq4